MQLLKRPASVSQEESGLFLTMGIITAILILLLAFGCTPAKKNTAVKGEKQEAQVQLVMVP